MSVYVRDPDENLLEFISYEVGDVEKYGNAHGDKGEERARRQSQGVIASDCHVNASAHESLRGRGRNAVYVGADAFPMSGRSIAERSSIRGGS